MDYRLRTNYPDFEYALALELAAVGMVNVLHGQVITPEQNILGMKILLRMLEEKYIALLYEKQIGTIVDAVKALREDYASVSVANVYFFLP